MKKITFYALTLFLTLSSSQFFGQSIAQQNLSYAIQTAENIPQDGQTAENAVTQLAKQIVLLGNPNVQLFNDAMFAQVSSIQNHADNIDYYVSEARTASHISFQTTGINTLTAELVSLSDELINLTYQITDAIDANDNDAALNLLPGLNSVLELQNETADQIIDEINTISNSIRKYNVCFKLVDYLGNPVNYNDLYGFYAQNHATGQALFPGDDADCFTNLAPGTYTFDSHDGYFSGTAPSTVTLSDSLVNANGIIEVTLIYWSE